MRRRWTSNEVVKLIEGIQSHTVSGKRSPHKAVLLRLAFDQLRSCGSSMISYRKTFPTLKRLLKDQTSSKSINPEYPFWYLQNDRLFEVISEIPLKNRRSGDCPSHVSLVRANALGKIPYWIEQCFLRDNGLFLRANRALDLHFELKSVTENDDFKI